MNIYNNICENCSNINICAIWKSLKKFDENYSRSPYPTNIEIKDCINYVKQDVFEDE